MDSNSLNNQLPLKQISSQSQGAPVSILIVDDEEDLRSTLAELLEMNNFKVIAADGGEHALKILETASFDVILSDLVMPKIDGIALTKAVIEMGHNIPIIVMTGFASIEAAVESMKAGASDFVTKPFNIDQIIIAINRILENRRLQKLAQEREYYENLSNIDALTELNNYRSFQFILQSEIERQKRYKRPLSLMMIDVDDFKLCNDTYGHLTGDMILQQIASLIKKTTRGCDYAARYGGEEFAVILPETSKQESSVVAERIRSSVESSVFNTGDGKSTLKLTVSIGIASVPEDAQDKDELVEKADKQMYRGKVSGKNCIYVAGKTERETFIAE